jgi:hypothetical protein
MSSRVIALNSLVFAVLSGALPSNAFGAPLFLANEVPINEATSDDRNLFYKQYLGGLRCTTHCALTPAPL